VVSATAGDARTLEVRPGAPLVSIVRTAWSADGRPFEHSRDLFRADRVRIVVRVRGRNASALGSAVEVVGLA
jgi:GntR family transcriptional regulator